MLNTVLQKKQIGARTPRKKVISISKIGPQPKKSIFLKKIYFWGFKNCPVDIPKIHVNDHIRPLEHLEAAKEA